MLKKIYLESMSMPPASTIHGRLARHTVDRADDFCRSGGVRLVIRLDLLPKVISVIQMAERHSVGTRSGDIRSPCS
jgi:hypothetical protein